MNEKRETGNERIDDSRNMTERETSLWKPPSIEEIIHCWEDQPPLKGVGWPILGK